MRFSPGIRLLSVVLILALVPSFSFAGQAPGEGAPATLTSSWRSVTSPSSATMYAIDLSSPTEGWTGGMAGFMFHYSGGVWAGESTDFDSPIQGLDMVSDSLGWGVTFHGHVIRYTGSGWSIWGDPDNPPSPAPLDDVSMVSDGDGWAVGGPDSTGHGTILRYSGGTWAQFYSPSTYWLKAVDMLSSTDGWAVGIGGTILHWDGGSWQGTSVGAGSGLLDVDAVSSSNAWAVGMNGVIYRFNGSSWQAVSSPTTAHLNAVHMLSPTAGWIVGDNGTILSYEGGAWVLDTASPTTKSLYAVSFIDEDHGWITGKDGLLLEYVPPPDLSTSRKSVDLHHAQPLATLTYTIRLANTGGNDAAAVQVTDPVPPGTTYVPGSADASQGTIVEPSGGSPLVANLGTLAVGATATVTFQVVIDETPATCSFVRNSAAIAYEGGTALSRGTVTVVGTCQPSYLPIALQKY